MNFSYLENKKDFLPLSTVCREAEEFVYTRPDISAISARKAMEWIVRYIYARIKELPRNVYTVYDMIDDVDFRAKFTNRAVLESVDQLRRIGNMAVYKGNLIADDSLFALERLHFLVGEFAVGIGIIEEYGDFVRPVQNRTSNILKVIHPDNFSLNIVPYLQDCGHEEWCSALRITGKVHIADLIDLPEEVNCDEFFSFMAIFEHSMKKGVEEILQTLPLSAATESEWKMRRAQVSAEEIDWVEKYIAAYIEDHQKPFTKSWTYYNQVLGNRAAAYLWLVHPDYVPESMRDAYVKPEIEDQTEEEEYISLEDAVKRLLRQLASDNLRKRELLCNRGWCKTNLGIPEQVLRGHSGGKVDRTLYSKNAVHIQDKKYFVYLKWDEHSLLCLRRLTGQLGESLVTEDRMADWGLAIPGSEAEKRAKQRAEKRKQIEETEKSKIRKKLKFEILPEQPKEAAPSEIRAYIREELDWIKLLPQLTSEAWCRKELEVDFPILISYEERHMLLRKQQLHGDTKYIYSAVMCSDGEKDYFIKRMTVLEFEHFKKVMSTFSDNML